MKKIKAGIIGSTGYAGQELYRILANHPYVDVVSATSVSFKGQKYADIYQNFNKISLLGCTEESLDEISKKADVVFLALPHGIASKNVSEEVLSNCKIIDLGADFRLKSKEIYEDWYKVKHESPNFLKEAVYGLCEVHREDIKNARLIANPGCYTTCSILTLYPLVKEKLIDPKTIVIDAKSGVSGAGRNVSQGNMYTECNESIKAYKVASHRHTPEIEQELSLYEDIKLTFTPHLTPMNRGILATCYANLTKDCTIKDVQETYSEYYKDEYFVRLLKEGIYPETRWVKGSNFIDIGFNLDKRTNKIIAMGAIDNLIKGAAGQAVQNMNLCFDIDEKEGLKNAGLFPV